MEYEGDGNGEDDAVGDEDGGTTGRIRNEGERTVLMGSLAA